MKLCRVLVFAACLVVSACKEDPARSVKIIDRRPGPARPIAPPASVIVTSSPTPDPDPNPQAEFCPPPAEDSAGPSSLIVNGPCTFQHRAAISCEALRDDFIAAFTRKAQHGATLVIFLNVEHYHGPGSYDGAQMFETLQSGTTIYRWSSDSVHATVGSGEAFVTLPETRLDEEPMLVRCAGLIGPANNYQFQCGGRSSAKTASDSAAEIVSGRLQCAGRKGR